jgi:hypothetical protein
MGTIRGRWPAGVVVAVALLAGCGGKPPATEPEPNGAPAPPAAPADAGPSYPRLPQATSRPPEWLFAEAPFDLTGDFEPIPPAENAAPLYLEALLEFSTELISCYPEEQRQALRDQRAPRNVEFGRVFSEWSDGRRVSPAEIDQAVAGYDEGFAKLARAQARPRCAFETGLSLSCLLPHIQACRNVANVVRLRNARDLERGEFRRPVDSLAILLRLSRDMRIRAPAITHLVATALEGVAKEVVLDILLAPGLTPEHADRLLAVLAAHDRACSPQPIADALRMEYVMVRLGVHDIEHRSGDFSPEGMRRLGATFESGGATIGQLLYGLAGQRDAAGDGRSAKQFDAQLALMTAADYRREAEAVNDYFRVAVEAVRLPYPRQAEKQDELARICDRGVILSAFASLPFREQVARGITRGTAARRGALCLAAVRRWQFDHTAPPPDLATAVRAAGIDPVPTDPFCDEPMRMVILDGEPVVYSVGSDGRDDKARVDWNNGQQPGDFIFRLKRTGK